MHISGWFMLIVDVGRKKHTFVKQLSFNLKINKFKIKREFTWKKMQHISKNKNVEDRRE